VVKRNGYRLLRMVDQLLHLEKFRVQQIVSRSPVQVRPIAKLIGESFQELAKEKNIGLTIKQLDDVWLFFTPDALEKILLNLLSNAIKYTLPGGHIELSVKSTENNHIEIIVSDSGIGIPKEQQSLVFERFHRVLDSHSEQITGAGIGLALVRDLVINHDGVIALESEPGKGSSFKIELPGYIPKADEACEKPALTLANKEIVELEIESIVEQKQSTTTHELVHGDAENDKAIDILVVEDNPDMRNYISSTLSNEYNVLLASNGKQGLAIATENIPDLIISDIMMPEMDGYTLCRSLKDQELTSHIPLILLTARSDRDSRLKGWKNKADEYLTKPFDSEELLLRVENLLNIRELLKQRFYENTQRPGQNHSDRKKLNLIDAAENTAENTDDQVQADINQWEQHERQFIDKFTNQIEKHIENPDLKVDRIAKDLAMSKRQLYRKLKGILNVTPADYLRSFRLDKALDLIKQGTPVSNVAIDVGFSTHSYFSRCFRAKYGKTPTEFREQLLQ